MLQVSDSAVAVLEEARSSQDIPDDHGLRVFGQPTEDGQVALSLAFVDGPAEGDQVNDDGELSLFVAPNIAQPLADSTITVEQTEQGPQLVIAPQNDGGSA